MLIAVCVKVVALRPEIDPLSGALDERRSTLGVSPADSAALETALRIAGEWRCAGEAVTVRIVAGAGAAANGVLGELAATGAEEVVRVATTPDMDSAAVASSLIAGIGDAGLVLCGDASIDRGSGSVPAFVAHHLHAAQALGLVEVSTAAPGHIDAVRRLGAGRSERLRVTLPAVLSVEGAVGRLRRAPLRAEIGAASTRPTVLPGVAGSNRPPRVVAVGGPRPRTHIVAPPTAPDARGRVMELAEIAVERTPPRTVEASAVDGADIILEQLRAWGYTE